MSFTRRLKSYFLRGMAVLLPTMLTIWIFVWGYGFIQQNIGIHINRGLVRLMMFIQGEGGISKKVLDEIWVHGAGSITGFIVALIGVCILGAVLASVFGKTLWRMVERFITNTPLLRGVYPYIKQVTDFLFKQPGRGEISFLRVVAAEYPRKGVWSVGMVTGSGLKKVVDNVEKEFLTVFIPTSPTPFTGFVIMVPKEQTIDLDMTIEEAFRFTISGGVITPGDNQIAALPKTGSEGKE